MRIPALQACVISCAMVSAVFIMTPAHHALAQEGRQGFGGIEAKKLVLGARAGFSPLTQSLTDDDPRISSDVGPLVNFQALYSLNTWLLVGMMLEWERHGFDIERRSGDLDLGHQDTVSVLNMSFGVNVNSFGEDSGNRISPSNTFAWRLGWGADYMLNRQFALNVEMGYKHNDGHARIDGTRVDDWNASSFGFLFGAKAFF
jgi:opacity protein-like surface antigen